MDPLLAELIRIPGISGYEDLVRARIIKEIGDLCHYQVDNMGNLTVELGSGNEELLIAAHMDEIGMVINYIDENGYLRVRKVGGLDPRMVLGQPVRIVTKKGEEHYGAVGVVPPHLMIERSEMKHGIPFEQMFIDVGASNPEEVAEMGIETFDQVVPEKRLLTVNNRFLMARGLDDRLGCWAVLELLKILAKEELPLKVTLAWTTQEEIGLRGAQALARDIRPNYAIAIDTISSGAIPQSAVHLANAIPGKGPALRMIDSRSIASPWLRDKTLEAARQNDIPVQLAAAGGGTDGGALQMTGAHMLPLAFPMRYTHAPCEMVHMDDAKNMVKLLAKLPKALASV